MGFLQYFISIFTTNDTYGRRIKATLSASDGSDILTNSDPTGGRRIKIELDQSVVAELTNASSSGVSIIEDPSGVLKTLIEGTNVTITDNGDGTITISSTGGGGGSDITVVANYSALPDPTTVSGKFYWCEASQGTSWLPGSLGGTYYNSGMYYSNGVSWTYMETPYQATQAEVNTGTNTNKFVTPETLANTTQVVHQTGNESIAGTKTFTDTVTIDGVFNLNGTTNNSLSGSNARIPSHTKSNITFTNSGLISIGSANNGGIADGHILIISNNTGNNISIVNNYGSAAAGEAIYTSTGLDVVIKDKTSTLLKFNSTINGWVCIGSGVFVQDAITDGVTNIAPSQNAVYDALALKAPLASPTFTTSVNLDYATASLPVVTDASKNLISRSIANFRSDIGVDAGTIIVTSGTSFTTPSGITSSTVFMIWIIGGGGGGGGSNTASGNGSGGGGGGGVFVKVTGLTASTSYTCAIGTGGTGGTGAADGTDGGSTTLTIGATTYTASGGGKGIGAISSDGGAGGTGTNGDLNVTGQRGGDSPSASTASTDAAGGNSPWGWGLGGAQVRSATDGKSGTGYGAGGSGGKSTTNKVGGNGTNGIIFCQYFN